MNWWDRIFRRRKWAYLGFAELKYTSPKDETKITDRFTVHFYADENELSTRKVEYGERSRFTVETHGYFEKCIIPWLNGENLWGPVLEPSEWLRKYTKEKTGYERVGGKWVKPAPIERREGNVITIKRPA